MKTYNFARTNETLYYDELKNGFKVYVVPTTNKDSFYAVIGVFYGSNDISFIPNGQTEYKETNLGIAHYLEHLAFANEEGEDPFSFFSKSGVNTNASTSFLSTKYYIWGNNDLKNNLDYLLNFVLTPYFTDENIKKELGVITEEIRMYEDEPNWVIDDLARKMAFKELPLKEKISGSYESIQKITKEELYDCYNTFYAPDNMFLIVSGNVSEKEVFDLVKNHKKLNSLLPKGKVKREEYDEILFSDKKSSQATKKVWVTLNIYC